MRSREQENRHAHKNTSKAAGGHANEIASGCSATQGSSDKGMTQASDG